MNRVEPPHQQPHLPPRQPAEQLRYARLLDLGAKLGLTLLALAFALYMGGLLRPHIEPHLLPQYWSLPVKSFVQATNTPTGWGWLALAHRGDFAGLLGIATLAGCSLLCLLALVPLYWKRGDRAFVLLCLAEASVLLLAASGLLSTGH